jgi:hypothetical protein
MAKAHASVVIDAPADAVWSRIRDFNGLPGPAGWPIDHLVAAQESTGALLDTLR